MNDSMIEKVAEALHAQTHLYLIPWETYDNKESFREDARATIEAMKEPTEAMVQASTMIAPSWDDEISKIKWQAMINAALNE